MVKFVYKIEIYINFVLYELLSNYIFFLIIVIFVMLMNMLLVYYFYFKLIIFYLQITSNLKEKLVNEPISFLKKLSLLLRTLKLYIYQIIYLLFHQYIYYSIGIIQYLLISIIIQYIIMMLTTI